jgi:CRP-like cAMP-binding protein
MFSMLWEDYAALPIFKGLSPDQFRLLDNILEFCQFPQGIIIFSQGKIAANLYILTEGEVSIRYKPYDGPPLTIAHIQPGGVFGWSAALGRSTYTSEAITAENSCTFRLSSINLHRFCERYPDVGALFLDRLASVIAARMRNTHNEILTILTKSMNLSDNYWRRLQKNDR